MVSKRVEQTLLIDANSVLRQFERLKVWKRGGERAPNKPLLVLWSIGRCMSDQSRLAPFNLIDHEVGELLREFGPPRTHVHTEAPFWRLQSDGVWEVTGKNNVRCTRSGDPYKRDLFRSDVRGGFPEFIYHTLRHDISLCEQIAQTLVHAHFPLTRSEDVLEAVGIRSRWMRIPCAELNGRDPKFRRAVLEAYEFGCALCGFAIRFDNVVEGKNAPIALDAAHIKWHQARGPAEVQNGIALCALHHRLFDAGAFTLTPDLVVATADSISGCGADEWLLRYSNQPLATNLSPTAKPAPTFLRWHRRNVFRG